MRLYVLSYRDRIPASDPLIIETTSRATGWSRGLSPFVLPGGSTWTGDFAKNVENLWQYSKVYSQHADFEGNPTDAWLKWAKAGWASNKADRYPMGKNAKPLYSYWNGHKLGYLDAKRHLYVPMYARSVTQSQAYQRLKQEYKTCVDTDRDLVLLDFDAYNHHNLDYTYDDVLNSADNKFGHAFVLAMLLEDALDDKFKIRK